jgi:16S rRNA G966 N2-methylase RsmD
MAVELQERAQQGDVGLLRFYSGRVLLRAVAERVGQKVARTLRRRPPVLSAYEQRVEVIVDCGGVKVRGRTDLSGGGPGYVPGYFRALLELGLAPCERVFEFCAGPGYIGYGLLGAGFCERLTLADINPESVEFARRTATENEIEEFVDIYESDALEQIPASESWDLVVGNPPHFLPESPPAELPRGLDTTSIIYFDRDWETHKKFYRRVKQFMKPGGHVVMIEDDRSSLEEFVSMIQDGGGEFVTSMPERDAAGRSTGNYYVASRW